jgi:hypothetical protein
MTSSAASLPPESPSDGHAGALESGPSWDHLMTADRSERKLLVAPSAAIELARTLNLHLTPHRFEGPGATQLPGGRFFATTIYFDTKDRDLYRAASGHTDANLKLRAREYYSLHPSLTQVVTDPKQLVRFTPTLWLEIKAKVGSRTKKRRIGIPKRDVPGFFGAGTITPAMLAVQRDTYGDDAARVLDEVVAICNQHESPLEADVLINYCRNAWQSDDGALRVTLDRNVSFIQPPADIWQRQHALVRETLPRPAAVLPDSVLELKSRGPLPDWLADAVRDLRLADAAFSKFVAGSRAVHGS